MAVEVSGKNGPEPSQASGPAMRIAFESTIEERVTAHMRLYELTGMLRRQMWLPLLLAPAGAVACFFLLPGTTGGRLFLALFFAAVYTAFHLLFYRSELRKQVRKVLVRQLGTRDPVPSEYELGDRGITFRQMGMEMTFEWASVREILDASDAVEFIVHPAGISRIPKRVFRDPGELRAWLDSARARMNGVIR